MLSVIRLSRPPTMLVSHTLQMRQWRYQNLIEDYRAEELSEQTDMWAFEFIFVSACVQLRHTHVSGRTFVDADGVRRH